MLCSMVIYMLVGGGRGEGVRGISVLVRGVYPRDICVSRKGGGV